jgi:hypothetical protein
MPWYSALKRSREQTNIITSSSAPTNNTTETNRHRPKRSKRQSYLAPKVAERGSSLYGNNIVPGYDIASFPPHQYSVSDLAPRYKHTFDYDYDSAQVDPLDTPPYSDHSQSFLDLGQEPELYFPAPPRLPPFRHDFGSRIWDELFDFAERYEPEPNSKPTKQSLRSRLVSFVQLDSRRGSTFDLPTSSRGVDTGNTGTRASFTTRWMRSEIWTKVSRNRTYSACSPADVDLLVERPL